MNPRTVLLIEDNPMNMELATDLLEGAGIEVVKAERAEDGIALALARRPDIILMDIALPGMDGLEATRRIKRDPRTANIPIVALTASAMRGDDDRAREAGCCGYIAKPIDTRRFVRTVAALMESNAAPHPGDRKRVLVVDDERLNLELMEAMLAGLGHEVEFAESGEEALAMLNATHDLVLLDVMMPGIDGFETARRIRADPAFGDVPICMATALTSLEERLRAVEAGASDFIAKPIDKLELRIRTASLLKGKAAQDAVKLFGEQLEERNRALSESYERLREFGELKDEFVRIASHDLKNPLMCILGFASMMETQLLPGAPMTEAAHGWSGKIMKHCRVMQKIIEDFLDFQALEDGQIKLKLEAVDLNALAREVMERNAPSAALKSIGTKLELEGESLVVTADRSRLSQVFENYVSNAIKFCSEGEQVTVCTRSTQTGVAGEVRDNGPGITEDDMHKLFVKYARLGNKPTGGESSSGLGLAICRKVVELQGGTTGVRRNGSRGSTFWFELPA